MNSISETKFIYWIQFLGFIKFICFWNWEFIINFAKSASFSLSYVNYRHLQPFIPEVWLIDFMKFTSGSELNSIKQQTTNFRMNWAANWRHSTSSCGCRSFILMPKLPLILLTQFAYLSSIKWIQLQFNHSPFWTSVWFPPSLHSILIHRQFLAQQQSLFSEVKLRKLKPNE